jgi:hypothetical protein
MNSFKINFFSDMKWIFSLFKVIYAGHSSAKFKKITEEWGEKTIIYKLRLALNEFNKDLS